MILSNFFLLRLRSPLGSSLVSAAEFSQPISKPSNKKNKLEKRTPREIRVKKRRVLSVGNKIQNCCYEYAKPYKILIIMYKNNALQEACLLLILIVGARCASLSITLDTTTINADSPYRFMIVDDNLKTFDGTIRLTFPSADYSISTLSVYNANDQS